MAPLRAPLALLLLAAAGCADPVSCEALDARQSADAFRTCVSSASEDGDDGPVTLADGSVLEPVTVTVSDDVSYERRWEPPLADTFDDGERVSLSTDGHLEWRRPGQELRRDSVGERAGRVAVAPTGDRYAYPLADGRLALRSRDGSDPVDLPIEIEWMEIGDWRGALDVRTAFSADGRRLAVADGSGAVAVVDARTGDALWRSALNTSSRPVALSADGERVAVSLDDGMVGVWRVASGTEVGRWEHPDRVGSLTFGADGSLIVWLAERTSTTRHRQTGRTTVGSNQSYESTSTTPRAIVVWRLP